VLAAGVARQLGLIGAAGAGLAAGVALGAWYQLFRRPLPRTRGSEEVEGLDGPVEIRRDRWGVPHVRAQTRADVWFAEGFCHGQDRLWQLELYRRAASGTIAEIAGRPAVASDRFVRVLGLRRAAGAEAEALEPGLRGHIDAYCAGVNGAATAARALPAEFQILHLDFEPWTAVDMLTTGKLLSLGLSTNWERELLRAEMARELGPELAARLDPGYPTGNPIVLEPGAPFFGGDGLRLSEQLDRLRNSLGLTSEATGSNNWAVSAQRSATSGPLFAGDPHLGPSMPGITYQLSLQVGDRFCRGASLPGQIGVFFGQNNDVAWSVTNALADVMDLFVERIDGDSYEFEGERLPLEVVEEEIPVRGGSRERVTAVATRHGPIVNEALRADDSEPLALRWMSLDFPTITEANVRILDVASGPELIDALESHHTPVSNFIWADRHGSIGYKTVGRIPLRRGDCPDLPKPGWTDEYEWDGWIPYAELPEIVDPDAGFLVSANNRIESDDYEHHITSDYFDGYRARRIEQLLLAADEVDLDDFARMQLDMYSIPGPETVHRLARLHEPGAGRLPLRQREIAAIERLKSWDGRMTPDSVAATIYQAFTLRFGREVARAAIGDRDLAERWLDRAHNGFMAHVTSPWRWQSHLLALWDEGDEELIGRPWEELALDALRGALDELATRFGPNPEGWRWGRVHALEFRHALGDANPLFGWIFNRRLEVGGAQETVAQIGWDPNDPFTAIWAPCWRIVADPVRPERSRWQQFTGQSGHPRSPHYDDLQERWLRGETQAMGGEGPWEKLELTPAPASTSRPGAAGVKAAFPVPPPGAPG
jgi:penicillin G amidase